jgi:tetratricopeptide (TPR) repeat protein
MKKYFITSFTFLLISFISFSQIQTPQPSPSSTLIQKVGLVDVKIEYSRPSMRGRQIFGGLIAYNEVWRTGANQNSKITFSDDVRIGASKLSKGTYSIYTRPSLDSWELILYKKTDNWGLPSNWDESQIALSTIAYSYALPFQIETFTIALNNLNNNGATLDFFWENTLVSFGLNTLTKEKTISSIEKTLDESTNSQDYYKAAVFYLEENLDINMAKSWIDKCFELRKDPPYWMLNQKALIYLAFGDKEGALKIANQGLAMAKETKLKDSIKTLSDTVEYVINN